MALRMFKTCPKLCSVARSAVVWHVSQSVWNHVCVRYIAPLHRWGLKEPSSQVSLHEAQINTCVLEQLARTSQHWRQKPRTNRECRLLQNPHRTSIWPLTTEATAGTENMDSITLNMLRKKMHIFNVVRQIHKAILRCSVTWEDDTPEKSYWLRWSAELWLRPVCFIFPNSFAWHTFGMPFIGAGSSRDFHHLCIV